jgi:hypothetical protein
MTTPRPIDWLLRDRRTGKLVIVQWPNLPLWIFIAAAVVKRVVHPHGNAGTAVAVISFVALMWWAVGEIISGVNPFRRILGAAVAVVTVVGLLMN